MNKFDIDEKDLVWCILIHGNIEPLEGPFLGTTVVFRLELDFSFKYTLEHCDTTVQVRNCRVFSQFL